MKAKEHAQNLMNAPDNEKKQVIAEIANDFIKEIGRLLKSRHATSDDAAFAVLRELDNKWRAMVRHLPERWIREVGFRLILKEIMPEIYESWGKHDRQDRLD
jgi:predicted DCC family thiol-disulfide oxidoreductase YuxK